MKLSGWTAAIPAVAAIGLLGGLTGAARPAAAAHAMLPEQHESVRDQMRCEALTKQFNAAAAARPVADATKDAASQGEVLCRAGRYGEGADTLEKAVRMIADAPAK